MGRIPLKCPKCGRTKAWREEINIFTSGIPMGLFGRTGSALGTAFWQDPSKKP